MPPKTLFLGHFWTPPKRGLFAIWRWHSVARDPEISCTLMSEPDDRTRDLPHVTQTAFVVDLLDVFDIHAVV